MAKTFFFIVIFLKWNISKENGWKDGWMGFDRWISGVEGHPFARCALLASRCPTRCWCCLMSSLRGNCRWNENFSKWFHPPPSLKAATPGSHLAKKFVAQTLPWLQLPTSSRKKDSVAAALAAAASSAHSVQIFV